MHSTSEELCSVTRLLHLSYECCYCELHRVHTMNFKHLYHASYVCHSNMRIVTIPMANADSQQKLPLWRSSSFPAEIEHDDHMRERECLLG